MLGRSLLSTAPDQPDGGRRLGAVDADYSRGPMEHHAIDIREFAEDDLEALVAFSLRAWEPVFASVQAVLGDEIFLRLHPDWKTSQEETVRSICMNDERDVYVAVVGARPVGFVAVALNAFHERMGIIEIIGVDPDYQRRVSAPDSPSSPQTTCAVAAWTSRSSRRAATQVTHRLVRCTAKWASRFCRSPVTSVCSTDATLASACVCMAGFFGQDLHASRRPTEPHRRLVQASGETRRPDHHHPPGRLASRPGRSTMSRQLPEPQHALAADHEMDI